jgi:energy-coupling factor transporter ATP-binding protein EcfA2
MLRDLDIFLPILRVYCPDVTSINIRPTFDFSNGFRTSKLLLTQSSGSEIDLTKLGQGRRRRITLAVYEWTEQLITQQEGPTPFEQTIVAFDEPDTHLDYTQQRKIFDIIKRISSKDDTNVIVCTHSLNLIDRIPITDIVHFRLEGGITRTSVITTDDPDLTDLFLYQISETMGLRNSAILNERCFLVVEGPTEVWSLPVLFKLKFGYLPQAAGIKILDGESGIGARLFAKFLSNNLGRNVIFLVDTDTTLSPHQRHFTREALIEDGYNLETQVHFVGAKEYEDAFTDETYLRAANTFWPKADGSEWNISEFQRLRGEDDFCDELMALIRRQTRSNVSKPKVGKQVAQSLGRLEDIPSEIDRCLQHAHDLANRD